jgi:hypothetical protein
MSVEPVPFPTVGMLTRVLECVLDAIDLITEPKDLVQQLGAVGRYDRKGFAEQV